MKLADDFGISYDKNKVPAVKPMHREISEPEKLKHSVNYQSTALTILALKLRNACQKHVVITVRKCRHHKEF